ncbi:MAG: amidohydrolase [Bacteroidetes bacterium]|nr:amidohydrolase [Bacteroidota bacterium]
MESILYHNASILTQNSKQPLAEAMLVENGKFVAVGRWKDVEHFATTATTRIDLKGKTVLPGFNDAHIHLWKIGQLASFIIDLRGVKNIPELQAKVKASLLNVTPGTWVTGRGFNEQVLEEKRMPTAEDLDAISNQHPIYLIRTCAHIAVVNSLAVEMAGVTTSTSAPQGGVIGKDEKGNLTGAFYETALGLITKHIPPPSQKDYENMIEGGIRKMLELGITSVTDPAAHPELLEAYYSYTSKKNPAIRLNVFPILLPDGGDKPFPIPKLHQSDFLSVDTVKFFSDGGLSGKTASLERPYKNSTDYGVLRLDPDQFFQLASEAQQKGFRVATHAIGDRAIDLVLRTYKKLHAQFGDTRNRLEHFGLPKSNHIDDMEAFRFVAVPQPVFLFELGENFIQALDEYYLSFCYPIRSLLERNIPVALSTDGPVVSNVNPWSNIKNAIQRKSRLGNWISPNESISLKEAMYAYTMGSAFAEGKEKFKGSIAPHYLADFIIVNQNPFDVSDDQLDSIIVEETHVNGVCMWKK